MINDVQLLSIVSDSGIGVIALVILFMLCRGILRFLFSYLGEMSKISDALHKLADNIIIDREINTRRHVEIIDKLEDQVSKCPMSTYVGGLRASS